LPVTVLRPFSLYGPGEAAGRLAPYLIAKVRAGEPVDLTAGEQLRDYAEVGDVAEAFWRALDRPPTNGKLRLLNIATGKSVTLRDFCDILATILRDAGYAPDLRFGARPYRPDEMMDYTADVSLLESTLGWIPATSLETGLRRMIYASRGGQDGPVHPSAGSPRRPLDRVRFYPRQLRGDARGWLLKCLDGGEVDLSPDTGEVYVVMAHPGQIRGGHYHPLAHEWFTLLQGRATLLLADPATGEREELALSVDKPVTVHVPPGLAHAFRAEGEPMLLCAYSDRRYDPKDTVPWPFA